MLENPMDEFDPDAETEEEYLSRLAAEYIIESRDFLIEESYKLSRREIYEKFGIWGSGNYSEN